MRNARDVGERDEAPRRSRRKARRVRLGWVLAVVAAAVVAAVAVGTSLEQDRQLDRIRQDAAEAEAKLTEAALRNRQAHDTLDSVGTDAYIEQVARDKLGMVKPGEKIIGTVD